VQRKGSVVVMVALVTWALLAHGALALQPAPPVPVAPSAYTGIRYNDANLYGVAVVTEVEPDSPAAWAGVRRGDIIVAAVYGKTVYSFAEALKRIPPDGVWVAKAVYPPKDRFVELVIRRVREGLRSPWWAPNGDDRFETVVVSLRWAAAPAQDP